MKKEELARLKELADKATPGEWKAFELGSWGGQGFGVFLPTSELQKHGNESKQNCFANDNKLGNPHDALFIAASREAVPKLIEMVARYQKALDKAKEQRDSLGLKAIKHVDVNDAWLKMNKEISDILEGK